MGRGKEKKAHVIQECRAGACGAATIEVRVSGATFGTASERTDSEGRVVGGCPGGFAQLDSRVCLSQLLTCGVFLDRIFSPLHLSRPLSPRLPLAFKSLPSSPGPT